MKVAYIGNFEPEHSTENHLKTALQLNFIEVFPFQENDLGAWDHVIKQAYQFDFILWTRTGWQPPIPNEIQMKLIDNARAAGVPVVGYHLDRWMGLNREPDLAREPFFKIDLNITADGHPPHQHRFERLGINHVWFPPGVSQNECLRDPSHVPEYQHDVVFCGSWSEYHSEWGYRKELCNWLMRTYGDRIGMYPRPGEHALRGQPLVDLYGNAKVIVGDSCLNDGITNYWSDRIPETLGRAGFLIHPNVGGLEDHFTPGDHLITYDLGDFRGLQEMIDHFIHDDEERDRIRYKGKAHVLETATYEVRVRQLVELLRDKGMLTV